jgi:hypothetical protein
MDAFTHELVAVKAQQLLLVCLLSCQSGLNCLAICCSSVVSADAAAAVIASAWALVSANWASAIALSAAARAGDEGVAGAGWLIDELLFVGLGGKEGLGSLHGQLYDECRTINARLHQGRDEEGAS